MKLVLLIAVLVIIVPGCYTIIETGRVYYDEDADLLPHLLPEPPPPPPPPPPAYHTLPEPVADSPYQDDTVRQSGLIRTGERRPDHSDRNRETVGERGR